MMGPPPPTGVGGWTIFLLTGRAACARGVRGGVLAWAGGEAADTEMKSKADIKTDDRRDLTRTIRFSFGPASWSESERCFGLYKEMRHPRGKSVTFSFPS